MKTHELELKEEIEKVEPYELKFYLECEYKPFIKTKHKCLRCRECTPIQFWFCYGLKTPVTASLEVCIDFQSRIRIMVKSADILKKQRISLNLMDI